MSGRYAREVGTRGQQAESVGDQTPGLSGTRAKLQGAHSSCWGSQENWGGMSWLNVLELHRQRDVEVTRVASLLPSYVHKTSLKKTLLLEWAV